MNKEINKEALKGENGRYLEEKYNQDLRLFFIDNPESKEEDFIEKEIEKINLREIENNSKWYLPDDEFYKELRTDERFKNKFINSEMSEEELKEYYLNSSFFSQQRSLYKPSEFENYRLTFYKLKLKKFQKLETSTINSDLYWKGTDLQFAELVKSLKECKLVSPELSQKELFKRLKTVFNVNDFNESDKLKEVRQRTKDLTPMINILETGLLNWIKKTD